ncbi:nucleotidyltransferase domain-containing protein [Candidatus Magnetaquicoccus inordinatus]|uniref:nucleotidyltransferase domain-containing protein n=1 Tax=Candidatus Magnetaquicoccus inordinatus TaxID=2496818 RepID=UPI00102B76D6|nr:nucleotidyltransferase domain-containing protein [Candidatus Magnetaquicoccus inordinatus]
MTITETELTAMSARIAETFHPERIILFGSHARGEAQADSDIDLLIITRETYGPHNSRRKAMARVWRLLADIPVAKDIVLFSDAEVEQWRTAKNHLIARALHEGRVLYERH